MHCPFLETEIYIIFEKDVRQLKSRYHNYLCLGLNDYE
jgi:hypothetical protein